MRFSLSLCIFVLGIQAQATGQPGPSAPEAGDAPPTWLSALTFYASFDGGLEAQRAKGDPVLYTSPAWDALDEAQPVAQDDPHVEFAQGEGRYGDALRFDSDWNPVIFFKASENVPYQASDWAGSYSFWLRVRPDEELRDGYSDPFIITDKNWDDASFYVDFTEEDRPRHFRFAAFSDKAVWNPERIPWEEVDPDERPMIDLADHPFPQGEWVHVVLTFEGANTSHSTGILTGYLNGMPAGRLDGQPLRVSWDMDRVLMAIGRHYRGLFDELAVFDRALTREEVADLFRSVPGEVVPELKD